MTGNVTGATVFLSVSRAVLEMDEFVSDNESLEVVANRKNGKEIRFNHEEAGAKDPIIGHGAMTGHFTVSRDYSASDADSRALHVSKKAGRTANKGGLNAWGCHRTL